MRMEVQMDDYPGETEIFGFFIRSFRNSIGDIDPPKYDFWNKLMDKAVKDNLPTKGMI